MSVVEGEGFCEFVSTTEPGYHVPSRKMMTTVLRKLYVNVKACVQTQLDEVDYVGLATDC